jgi:methionyl-tRNA formyltransferase
MPKASKERYLVLGCKSWNRRVFDEVLCRLPGQWRFIGSADELTPSLVRKWGPRRLFFLHWSWKVPDPIVREFDCVCFHMTDLPYGRGGSPLQNLIVRGHRETKLTALRMTAEFDAGPIYLKEPLSLDGSAEEVLIRASRISARMIEKINRLQPRPRAQRGRPTVFRRRKPAESAISPGLSLPQLHDFIRMLDGEGYPRAYLDRSGFRYEFSRATLRDGRIVADVAITPVPAQP